MDEKKKLVTIDDEPYYPAEKFEEEEAILPNRREHDK